MIDVGLFQFACTCNVGASWFCRALQMAGLGVHFRQHVYGPFPDNTVSKLRVTMVRHPCSWLSLTYAMLHNNEAECNHLGPFASSPLGSLDEFVVHYLRHHGGAVGEVYGHYRAGCCQRTEDQPWALEELLRSLGVKRAFTDRVLTMNITGLREPAIGWDRSTWHRKVIEAERELCEQNEYW